jgi:hypothetical protein
MRLKLIDDWKSAHKLASVRLAAFAAALATIIVANQGLALSLIGLLPNGAARTVAGGIVGAIVFLIPALSRVVQVAPKDNA